MKFYLAIFSIAMMAQASTAGSLERVQRADVVEDAFEDLFQLSRELVKVSVTVVTEVYKQISEADEHPKLKQELKEFLDFVHDLEDKSENCVLKTGKALEALFKLIDKYDDGEEESSADTKELEELFEKNYGGKLIKDTKDFAEKYYNESFLQNIDSYKEESVEKLAFLEEVC